MNKDNESATDEATEEIATEGSAVEPGAIESSFSSGLAGDIKPSPWVRRDGLLKPGTGILGTVGWKK